MPTNYISSALILMGSGYIIFRILVRNDYRKRGKLSPLSAFLEFVFFALHANAMYLFIPVKWPELPPLADEVLLYYTSLVLIIIGLVVVITAMLPLGYFRAMGLRSKKLKTNGLYSLTRNPQLVGYYLILIGFAVSYPSVYSAAWIIIFGVVVHWMVITEEEYLLKIYGQEYEDYCKRTPRYLSIKVSGKPTVTK
jgi:protein-S-isoprenylcysteine O-methyltransferase Ste14